MLTSGVPPIARCTGERQQECRHKVSVDITVVLGTTSMPIHPVLRLGRGAIIELDASEEDPASVLAMGCRWRREPWWSKVTGSPWR
jgi:flagellar motor switch protein FliM/N